MISVVSAAKDNIDALDVEFGISFMYNKNKRGPRIDQSQHIILLHIIVPVLSCAYIYMIIHFF